MGRILFFLSLAVAALWFAALSPKQAYAQTPQASYTPPPHPCPKYNVPPFCGNDAMSIAYYCYPNCVDPPPAPIKSTPQPGPRPIPSGTGCEAAPADPAPGCDDGGLISIVVCEINGLVRRVGERLFKGIVCNTRFTTAVGGAMLLYVMIYGIMIMFNMASYSPGELMKRFIQLALVLTIIHPKGLGWEFFLRHFVEFFINGMDQLINFFNTVSYGLVTSGSIGGGTARVSAAPLGELDTLVMSVFSRHFLTMMAAMPIAGPFGFIVFFFLMIGVIFFFLAIIGAVVSYIRAVVGLYFLFGIAPIFLVFSLFQRTRQLFMAWINQIVSFFFQPVLIFAFLAFFVRVLQQSIDGMLYKTGDFPGVPFCWAPFLFFDPLSIFSLKWFRPAVIDGGVFRLYTGDINIGGPAHGQFMNGSIFPIDTSEMFLFVLWTFLAWRYQQYIIQLVESLTDHVVDLTKDTKSLGQWFRNKVLGRSEL